MQSLFKPARAILFFCALFAVNSATLAEEAKSDSSPQSSVAAQGSSQQSGSATAKGDEPQKKPSSDPEPDCNN